MDEFQNPKSQFFNKSLNRIEILLDKLLVKEKRYSFIRLSLTLLMLAILFSKWPGMTFNEKSIGVVGFIAFTLILVKFHNFLKKKIKLTLSFKNSYFYGIARAERKWDLLSEKKIKYNPTKSHPYAIDLDITTQVPLWIATCVLKRSNEKLMDRLCLAGIEPPPLEERIAQAKRCEYLKRKTILLRKLDAQRFIDDESTLELSQENFKELAHSKGKYFQILFVCLFICAAWASLLIPAYFQFFSSQDTETFFHTLLLFIPFPLFGAMWLKPWTTQAHYWSQEVRSAVPLLNGIMGLPQEFIPPDLRGADKALKVLNRINLVLDALEVRGNPLLWMILHALVPYDGLLGLFLSRAIKILEDNWPQWREGLMSFDMDCALARAAVEDPGLTFMAQSSHQDLTPLNTLVLENMGHPLIPFHKRVLNSFSLNKTHPARLLTGSNMSGKSTFLRSLGLNSVLFNLGGPVCAQKMAGDACLVLCAIQVEDSLSNATSYFYAEVKRLSHILKTLSQGIGKPGLYLVDEIFKGTNNKERILGSWYVIQALLDSKAFGVVSTHDLALAALEAKDGRILNCHFKERVSQGELVFDYTLRQGPCPTTNALHIMRMEGLPVPDQIPDNINLF